MICSLNLKMPGNYEHKALLYYFLSNRIAYNALCISLTYFSQVNDFILLKTFQTPNYNNCKINIT